MLVRRSAPRFAVRCVACLLLALVVSLPAAATEEEPCTGEIAAMQAAYQQAAQAAPPRYEEVLPFVEAAFACLGPVATEAHARVSEYEAFLLLEMGRTEQLLLAFERYFRDLAHAAPPNRHARQLTRYGFLLDELNLHGESLAAYAEAAGLADRLTALEAGRQLSETGEHYRELGRLADAGRYFAAADSHFAVSDRPALYHLGLLRLRQARLILSLADRTGRDDPEALHQALIDLDEADQLFPTRSYGSLQLPIASIGRATVLRRLGRFAEASAALDRAEVLLADLDDRADRLALYYEERVRTALRLGDVAQAQEAAVAFRVLGDSTQTLDHQSRAHTLLGLVAEATAEASARDDATALEDAEAYYQRAMQYALDGRARFGLIDVAPAAWVEGQRPFRALVRLHLRQGRYAEAFSILDASRARYFRDLRYAAQRRVVLTPRRRAALDSLVTVQEEARRALDRVDLDVAERSRLVSEVQRTQLAIDTVSTLVSASAVPPVARLSVEVMQALLRPQRRALVTFFLDAEEGAAFVLTADTLVASSLSPSAVSNLVAEARVEPGAYDPATFHALYCALLAPFESVLTEIEALVVIPEGVLAGLPFALLTTASTPPGTSPPYLVRRHAIATALSASSFFATDDRADEPELDLLALGRTTFDLRVRPPWLTTRTGDGRGQEDSTFSLASLPLVESELRAAHRKLGGRILLDGAATKSAFFQGASRARVLHLASHALVDLNAPMSSYVVLASDDAEDGTSSLLYLSEIQQASLAAELVLLSACSTAQGEAHLSEGILGLQYAFQAAGARSVLATAWPVNDAAMADLVEGFYDHLSKGLSKDRALQRAQLDYLDRYQGVLAHPSYWGGLVIQGDVAPLDMSGPRVWFWLLLSATLLGGVILIARRLTAS